MDVAANFKIKSLNTEVICHHIAKRVSSSLKSHPSETPQLDISLGNLKDLVVKGFIQGINHFATKAGRDTLLKGIEKINLHRCFQSEFQAKALLWVDERSRSRTVNAILSPETHEIDIPSSSLTYYRYEEKNELDELPIEVIEEELIDLLEMDE